MFNKWSTLKKLIWLKASGAIGDAWSTITGEVVRFMSTSALPFRLTAQFEPIQDLHGYDNPWPAGGGKNLYAGALSAQTKNGVTIEPTSDGEIWIHGTPDIASDYISFNIGSVVSEKVLNQNVTVSINEKTAGIGFTFGGNGALNLTLSDTVTTKTANFGASTGDCYINVRYDVGTIDKRYKVQIEIGSSATAWTPYSNECPIIGHTGCEVVQRNKNLLSYYNEAVPYEANGVTITRNENVYTVSVSDQKTGWPFARICTLRGLKAGTYTLSCEKDGEQYSDVGLGLRIVNRTVNPAVVIMSTGTTTIANDIEEDLSVEIALTASAVQTGTYYVTGQLELGSVATKHVAPQGTTKTITFPDASGTVYSGTLTVNEDGSGELEVPKDKYVFSGSEEWSFFDSEGGFFYTNLSYAAGHAKSNHYLTENGVAVTLNIANNQCGVWLNRNEFLSQSSDLNDYLSNGIGFLYDLATPITIPLTAEQVGQLVSLVGTNIVWVNDSDEITVVVRGTPIPDNDPNALQSLNILLGGAYTPRQSPNEPKDSEALGIILGS